jgi:hypothetical protein
MKSMFSLFLFVTTLSTVALAGDFYSWASNGNCHEYSNGGADRGQVADYNCGGDFYAWASNGNCHQYSNGGADRGQVSDNNCN